MKLEKIFILFGLLMVVMNSAFATFNITSDTTSVLEEINTNQSISGNFTLTISGNETSNMSLTMEEFTASGLTNVSGTLNVTSIENADNGSSYVIGYTSGTFIQAGNFTSEILIFETSNTSNNVTVNVTAEVLEPVNPPTTGVSPDVEFVGEGSTLDFIIEIDDSSERETFELKNTGNVELFDVEIDLESSFDGDDDEIDDNDFEINGEDGDQTFRLKEDDGEDELSVNESYNVKLTLDIPSNLDVDDYRGDISISYKYLENGTTKSEKQDFTLEIIAESDSEDIEFKNNIYVMSGILELNGEPDETIDDIEIDIENYASYDVDGLRLAFEDSVLEEENSALTLPVSAFSFSDDVFSIYENDEETIDLEVVIPEDQATGTYFGDLELISSTGKTLDTIRVEVKVRGDVYISEIEYEDIVEPGDALQVKVTVNNEGTTTFRNIQVKGFINDIDSGNSDLDEVSSTFLLQNGDERTETLRFKIPEDASDGSKTLELYVNYDGEELYEIETISVSRPLKNIVLRSAVVTPSSIDCEENIFAYLSLENLGRYDEDVKVTAEITGTDIFVESSLYELEVDQRDDRSLTIDVSSLEEGTYEIVQKVTSGSQVRTKTSTLYVSACEDESGFTLNPIDTEELNESDKPQVLQNDSSTYEVFGQEVEKTTAYLGAGVGVVIIAIIATLFFL